MIFDLSVELKFETNKRSMKCTNRPRTAQSKLATALPLSRALQNENFTSPSALCPTSRNVDDLRRRSKRSSKRIHPGSVNLCQAHEEDLQNELLLDAISEDSGSRLRGSSQWRTLLCLKCYQLFSAVFTVFIAALLLCTPFVCTSFIGLQLTPLKNLLLRYAAALFIIPVAMSKCMEVRAWHPRPLLFSSRGFLVESNRNPESGLRFL